MFWLQFSILFVAALFGGLAIIPYTLRLLKASTQTKPLKMSVSTLLLLSFLQTAVLSALAIGMGLLTAHSIGHGAPYVEALAATGRFPPVGRTLQSADALGLLAGLTLVLMDILFLPHLRPLLELARNTSLQENSLASFYGGINEEFLTRLFGFSIVAWLLSRVWHTSTGMPTSPIFSSANIIMATIFGVGHLPAAKNLLGKITPLVVARTLLLNAPIGLICGWLFWHYGIEAAVVAHFAADVVYHVGGTLVLRLMDRYQLVRE